MTARQIIEARLGRPLPPTHDLPPDLRDALRLLGLQLVQNDSRYRNQPADRTKRGWVPAYKGEECPW